MMKKLCPNCDTKMETIPIVIGDKEIGHDIVCPNCVYQYDGE